MIAATLLYFRLFSGGEVVKNENVDFTGIITEVIADKASPTLSEATYVVYKTNTNGEVVSENPFFVFFSPSTEMSYFSWDEFDQNNIKPRDLKEKEYYFRNCYMLTERNCIVENADRISDSPYR